MLSTISGICFSLEAKPNAMKTFDSCTVRAQSPICIGDRSCSSVDQNVCLLSAAASSSKTPTASEEAAIIDGKRISKEHLMKVIRESFFSEPLLASYNRISLADLPRGTTLLEKKMALVV